VNQRKERARERDGGREGDGERCFSGTGVSGLASHNMSELPAPPFFTRRRGGSLNYAPPLMMAECLTLCSLHPLPPRLSI